MTVPYLLEQIVVGPIETNCYLLADAATHECAVIDPGDDSAKIITRIAAKGWKPVVIINTHSHADHIGANGDIKKTYHVPLMIHRDDADDLPDPARNLSAHIGPGFAAPAADRLLAENDTIAVGQLTLRVVHTPGHTRGGIVLAVEDLLFTGDTLFCGTVGRTDLPGGSDTVLAASLKKFDLFPKTMRILPGHGRPCTLEKEYTHNFFLGRSPR